MASIHRHPRSPFWMAHFFEAGKRTTRSTRVKADEENREKAQRVATMFEQAAVLAGKGRDGRSWAMATLNEIFAKAGVPEIADEFVTWASVAKRFLANQKTRRKASASTVAGYETALKAFSEWLGARAKRDIKSITPRVIDQYASYLQKRYSPATVTLRLTQVGAVFTWAVRQELVDRNPVTKVEKPPPDSLRRTPFTIEEINRMIATARQEVDEERRHADHLLTMLLFGICTGARILDCARMRWEYVDLQAGRIAWVPAKKGKRGHVLRFALVEPLRSHLQTLPRESEWICPAFAHRSSGDLSAIFSRFMDRVGIERENTKAGRVRAFRSKSFHGLRHTLATLLYEAGVDELVRRRITGHEDKAVAAIYTHVSEEATERALESVLEKVLKG